jgi:hypothetical protein
MTANPRRLKTAYSMNGYGVLSLGLISPALMAAVVTVTVVAEVEAVSFSRTDVISDDKVWVARIVWEVRMVEVDVKKPATTIRV